jgi:hypothetical protein
MEGIILLNAQENTKQVEEEEKNRFVKNILETLGVPSINDIWGEGELTVDAKVKLRNLLSSFNINIIDDMDGGLKIYVDQDVVAEFKKPTYILKRDNNQIDPKKKNYLQMTISTWSAFDE